MSYLDYDLGYDSGYDTPQQSTRRTSRNPHRFAPEGSDVSYAMSSGRVDGGGGNIVIEDSPPPVLFGQDGSASVVDEDGDLTPLSPEDAQRARSQAAQLRTDGTPETTETAPESGDNVDTTPTPRAPGAQRAPRRSAPIRSNLASFNPREAQTLNSLSEGGIDPALFYQVIAAPRTSTEVNEIQTASPEQLNERFHQGIESRWNRFFRQQGVSEEVGQDYLRARGLIDENGERTDLSSEELNRHAEDLAAMREDGLGPRHGREDRVRTETTRMNITEGWIERTSQLPGWNRDRAVATLEQMEPALMRNGRNTDFDPNQAAQALYRVGDGSQSPLTAEGELSPNARPITPQSAVGAEAIQAADERAQSRDGRLGEIRSDLDSLGINQDEQNAILGAQTVLGNPLVDDNGELLPNVSDRQLELYGEALNEHLSSLEDLETEAGERQAQLDRGGLSDSARERLQDRIDSANDRAEESRTEVAQELRGSAAEYYRSQMPEHLREIGLNEEQAIQWMNGRGHLAERPDLTTLAADFNEISEQRGRGVRNQYRQEIQTNENGAYVRPRGDSPEATRAERIARSFDGQGNAGRRGRGRGGNDVPFASTEEGVERSFENQRTLQQEQAQAQRETQERMAGIQHDNQLELNELQQEFQRELTAMQGAQQLGSGLVQSLGQMLQGMMGPLGQMSIATSQNILQGTAQMLPRAPDASQWYGNASGQGGGRVA